MSMDKKLVADLTCSLLSGMMPSNYRYIWHCWGQEGGNGRTGLFSGKSELLSALKSEAKSWKSAS